MNYFELQSAAERYAKGRPDFHENTISRIAAYLNITEKYPLALDVACGTGLSTKALLKIADQVYGTDSADEMLRNANPHVNIKYLKASAENLPFENDHFQLITVSSGVHWFNIDKFLSEAQRVLKTNAHLVLYDNFFISEMVNVDAFSNWFPDSYLKKFPSPKRNEIYNWTNEHTRHLGFEMLEEDEFKNPVCFNIDQLILYFTTQSNITAQIETGQTTYLEVEAWLRNELQPFFQTSDQQTINFGNWIKYLRKLR